MSKRLNVATVGITTAVVSISVGILQGWVQRCCNPSTKSSIPTILFALSCVSWLSAIGFLSKRFPQLKGLIIAVLVVVLLSIGGILLWMCQTFKYSSNTIALLEWALLSASCGLLLAIPMTLVCWFARACLKTKLPV